MLRSSSSSAFDHITPFLAAFLPTFASHKDVRQMTTKPPPSRSVRGFMDLPRELRNRIYALALWQHPTFRNGNRDDYLLLSAPAKSGRALSQVSRSVRAESMRIYYSQTQLYCHIASLDSPSADRIREWLCTWGGVAVPSLRRLHLYSLGFCTIKIELGKHCSAPVQGFPMRAVFLRRNQVSQIEEFVLALFLPGGEVKMTPKRLVALLKALRKASLLHKLSDRDRAKLGMSDTWQAEKVDLDSD